MVKSGFFTEMNLDSKTPAMHTIYAALVWSDIEVRPTGYSPNAAQGFELLLYAQISIMRAELLASQNRKTCDHISAINFPWSLRIPITNASYLLVYFLYWLIPYAGTLFKVRECLCYWRTSAFVHTYIYMHINICITDIYQWNFN